MSDLISFSVASLSVSTPAPPGAKVAEIDPHEMQDGKSGKQDSGHDPYRVVVLVLLIASALGTVGAIVGSQIIADPVLFDLAITLGIATGLLTGVAVGQSARDIQGDNSSRGLAPVPAMGQTENTGITPEPQEGAGWRIHLTQLQTWAKREMTGVGARGFIRAYIAALGTIAIGLVLISSPAIEPPSRLLAGFGLAICVLAAGVAAIAARYLQGVDTVRLPEGAGLCHGARVVAWILVLTGVSIGLTWAGLETVVEIVHYVIITINLAACFSLFLAKHSKAEALGAFPLDLEIISVLGARPNIAASILDAAEAQLGIDLRSTWALTVVRRGIEPLAICLCLLAWFSTSLTVVGMQEEGLIERLGVAVGGEPLQPGLHLHWPWPIDRIYRIPVRKIQATTVGHEGQEDGGPENVLWAVEHAANEYTLLLGNGRDLITVDAALQFRIIDARAWRYHCQNPADALRAIAYRAVMRSTVNRTLSETLSENVVALTGRMREMVQQDADALGLGVEIVAFTVGGMHPPVAVASAYQAVVSAEIGKVTAVVGARAYHNEVVPAAEANVLIRENTARADGVKSLARAAGEAWSFRTVESQYRASPQEYFFRRRLETLESVLSGLQYIVVDSRFQRDGGELWLIP